MVVTFKELQIRVTGQSLYFLGLWISSWRLKSGLSVIVLVLLGCNAAESPSPASKEPAFASVLSFTDVTQTSGLGSISHQTGARGDKWFPETMGAGGGFVDIDGDGWQDIVLVGGGLWMGSQGEAPPALHIFRNNGDATFSSATKDLGIEGIQAYGFGLTMADYDNDSDPDIFLTALYENLLFRNDGGSFTEVGAEAGLAEVAEWSSSALFWDADRDGWLDLYVGNYVDWSAEDDIWCTMDGETKSYCTPELYPSLPGRFYHNNGDGTFSDWTAQAGFSGSPGKTLAVADLDYNEDGWPDLVVANDTQRDLLYENQGDGTFVEKGIYSGIAFDENGRARAGMGLDVGDVENEGDVSIFVGNFSKEMIGVYRHIGSGLFIDRAAVSKIGQPSLMTLTFGLFLFDADLDTDLDLFLANGHISPEIEQVEDAIAYRQPAQLFLNRGDGVFSVMDAPTGVFAEPMVARGTAYADYDRDGDLDVLVTENGGAARLWRNDLSGANYLRVCLEGVESQPDGIGAKVVAVVGDTRQQRRVRTGRSYLSQSELTNTFGLGAATQVDSLVVYWPSGHVDRLERVDANQEITMIEGGSMNASTLPES